MTRREQREAVLELLFETEFKTDEAREAIFALSTENREVEDDPYIHSTYFGVCEHLEELDDLINRHANGWKTSRISRVSRSIMRLAIFEMRYFSLPAGVAINEAVEIAKGYVDADVVKFINGILGSFARGQNAEV